MFPIIVLSMSILVMHMAQAGDDRIVAGHNRRASCPVIPDRSGVQDLSLSSPAIILTSDSESSNYKRFLVPRSNSANVSPVRSSDKKTERKARWEERSSSSDVLPTPGSTPRKTKSRNDTLSENSEDMAVRIKMLGRECRIFFEAAKHDVSILHEAIQDLEHNYQILEKDSENKTIMLQTQKNYINALESRIESQEVLQGTVDMHAKRISLCEKKNRRLRTQNKDLQKQLKELSASQSVLMNLFQENLLAKKEDGNQVNSVYGTVGDLQSAKIGYYDFDYDTKNFLPITSSSSSSETNQDILIFL